MRATFRRGRSGCYNSNIVGVPHVNSFARTDDERQLFDLIFGAQALGRPFASPPGQPAERTRALRAALMTTMQDEAFLADAARTQIVIDPMSGEEVEALIAKVSSASPAVVARAKRATSRD